MTTSFVLATATAAGLAAVAPSERRALPLAGVPRAAACSARSAWPSGRRAFVLDEHGLEVRRALRRRRIAAPLTAERVSLSALVGARLARLGRPLRLPRPVQARRGRARGLRSLTARRSAVLVRGARRVRAARAPPIPTGSARRGGGGGVDGQPLQRARRRRATRRQADIKKAYRKLARESTPTRTPATARPRTASSGSPRRTRRSPTPRSAASTTWSAIGRPAGPQFDPSAFRDAGGVDLSDLLGGLFNRGGRRGGDGARAAAERGNDLQVGVTVSFADSLAGARLTIPVDRLGQCAVCHGSGAQPGTLAHDLPRVPRPRRQGAQPGLLLAVGSLRPLRRRGHDHRASLRRPAAARAACARPSATSSRSPPASRTASASGSRARARPDATAARSATSTCRSRSSRRPSSRGAATT